MRETHFIEQNKGKWIKFEKVLKESKKDPEEMSDLFMEITDDLSYSRTFYPNRSVRVYLNNVAQRVFYNIYKNRKSRFKRFWQFWKDDVPQILFESRFDMLLAFGIFMLAVTIGVFSTMMDPEFPRVILGDGYVEMTLENIQKGNPMSVYQDENQTGMFFRITLNNLRVAFMAFILGLTFGGGTIYILLFNGIMVGAFQYFFIREGVYLDSILTIWLHGAIEISCIVIAGAAGIHLGRGMLFPGTYTRMQGLQLAARRALLIYLSIAPLIIIAGFIEGFITRYSDAPYIIRALLIIFSFIFMGGYFVWYPWRKAQRGFTANLREVNLPPTRKRRIEFNKIKNSGQIFTDAFSFYRKNLPYLAIVSAVVAFVYTAAAMWVGYEFDFWQNMSIFFFFESIGNTIHNTQQIMFLSGFNFQWLLNVFAMATISFFTLYKLFRYARPEKPSVGFYIQAVVSSLVISCMLNALLVTYNENSTYGLIFIYVVFLCPILIFWQSNVFNERTNLLSGLGKAFRFMGGNWPTMMGAYLVMGLMCFVFLFLTTAPILAFFENIIVSLLPFTKADAQQFHNAFFIFLQTFAIGILLPLVYSVLSIAQHSFRETKEASELLDYIPTVGLQKRSYGMDREN